MIYAIRSGLASIKFGKANNPKARLNELQTGNPSPLVLEAALPWHDGNERLLHACFADERIRGEWFEITDRVDQFLRILSADEPDDHKFVEAMSFIANEADEGRAPLVDEIRWRDD